jgi:hypothetical protein
MQEYQEIITFGQNTNAIIYYEQSIHCIVQN